MSASASISPFKGTKTPGCFACDNAGETVELRESDDLALCTVHWNWWVTRHLARPDYSNAVPPCSAHLMEGQR